MARAKAQVIHYPTCVRHLKPRKDVRLRHYFLCDKCASTWTKDAFDGNEPLAVGESLSGICQLCNERTKVRLRTWFLCDICHRVAGSIGRNHVAEQGILDWWAHAVTPRIPYLRIEQNDLSALRPRRDGDISGEGPLDFLIRDKRSGKVAFGIENKTGRSSLRDMSAFQLDISDCDSILHHIRSLSVPAYLIHAQVLEVWTPPTHGFEVHGLWWTDIYRMAEHFRDVRIRRDERRGAAFFRKSAFEDVATLVDHICDDDANLRLVRQFKQKGVPELYQLD
ncbi:hypothetical protein HED60_13960 [Planctomycetales bacterium ZRK34]|nr:hypothetical protein HED60_13960 [Planctomycetales bacterium ZRK34]